MRTLANTACLLALAALLASAQPSMENRDRGATRLYAGPAPIVTVDGTLVDAGCRDRSAYNIGLPSLTFSSALPAETTAEVQTTAQMRAAQGYQNATQPATQQNPPRSVNGITVDSKTLEAERRDVLEHQVPDLHARQMDPTCAITGQTHGFAVVIPAGRMFNLDDGGNTFANEAVNGSSVGREMLAGNGGGFKPKVTIKGRIRADILVVQSLKLTK